MRKISVEKRSDALMQKVRDQDESNKKINDEIRVKEEEIGQIKNQLQEKENLLSGTKAEVEDIKRGLESCQEREKIANSDKEECLKKTELISACQQQVQELEKNKRALLDIHTTERIRILTALAKTYGKKLLDLASQSNIVVNDVPLDGIPDEPQLNAGIIPQNQGQPQQGQAEQGQTLHFVSRNGASQNDNLIPPQGAGNLNLANNQPEGNAWPLFPRVQLVGSENNLPQQSNNMAAQDSNVQVNVNQIPNNTQNAMLNARQGGAAQNNQEGSYQQQGQMGEQSRRYPEFGAPPPLNASTTNTTIPALNVAANAGGNVDPNANALGNENIPGERPQGENLRMMAQQGAPAIIEEKTSKPLGDQVPLDSVMAPNGDGAAMQQAPPPGGNLAPQGVQGGEGPQGQDQVNPAYDDRIEVHNNQEEELDVDNRRMGDDQRDDMSIYNDGDDRRVAGLNNDFERYELGRNEEVGKHDADGNHYLQNDLEGDHAGQRDQFALDPPNQG